MWCNELRKTIYDYWTGHLRPRRDPIGLAPREEAKLGRAWWIIVGLVACNVIVFGQVLSFEFLIWDDDAFVVRHLRRVGPLSPQSVVWAFTNTENGWITPLPYLSLLADAKVFGLNPAGYHLTNLLIHTIAVLLLFDTLRCMTGHLWASATAAVLFAIHPLHVEPVAWVAGRWDLLCGLFWILGMAAYARYCRGTTFARMSAVLAAYVCALSCKPVAITFPFALLLLDYWPLRRVCLLPEPQATSDIPQDGEPLISLRRAVLEKLSLFGVMAIALPMTAQAKVGFIGSTLMTRFSPWERLLNAGESYAMYVVQFVWPRGLSFYYPHPALMDGFSTWRLLGTAMLLVAITVISLALRRLRFLLMGWLWFLGVLVPVIGFVQVEHHARADRYMYVPLIGLSIMGGWGIAAFYHHLGSLKRPVVVLSVCCLVCFAATSAQRVCDWRDSRSLFSAGVQGDSRNFKAWHGLGELAMQSANYRIAEEYFRRASHLYHSHGYHEFLVGRALLAQGDDQQAIACFRESLQRNPLLTIARKLLADAQWARGNISTAAHEYEQMIRLTPDNPDAHEWFGDYLGQHDQPKRALHHYRLALDLDPLNERLPKMIGDALLNQDHAHATIRFYDAHLHKLPHRLDIAKELAWLLSTRPEPDLRNAAKGIQIAEQLRDAVGQPDRFILDTLGVAYAGAGRFEEAAQAAQTALRLAQDAADAEHVAELKKRVVLFEARQPYLED